MFLISSYGAPLAQRASYLALHSSLFGTDGTVNYDYIVTNSINCLLIGSRCIPNGTHTNHFWPMLQNVSKTLIHIQSCIWRKSISNCFVMTIIADVFLMSKTQLSFYPSEASCILSVFYLLQQLHVHVHVVFVLSTLIYETVGCECQNYNIPTCTLVLHKSTCTYMYI